MRDDPACGVELVERKIICWGQKNHHGYSDTKTGPFAQGKSVIVSLFRRQTLSVREG